MKIEICMGSSCFARGNAQVLKTLELYAAQFQELEIELTGHLCLADCSKGPNLVIDGELFHGLQPEEVISLIEQRRGQTA